MNAAIRLNAIVNNIFFIFLISLYIAAILVDSPESLIITIHILHWYILDHFLFFSFFFSISLEILTTL